VAIRADDIDLARDRALVEAWQGGDAAAFDDLYRMYFDRVRSYCQRRVNDHAAAEELAQEAFVKALQALPRFSGERRFYPWMTVIASRLCIDHHRRNRRVQPSDDVDPGWVEDEHHAQMSLQVDLDHLDSALRRLGPRHAEVLDLRERRGLTYDQIAGELGVPHSTVETLLFRARRALRREFHLVSADRLAAVPGLGWLSLRLARLRVRLAMAGADLPTVAAPLAAGAVTAVLAALPSLGGPAPLVVATHARPPAAVAGPAVAPAPAPTPIPSPTAAPAAPHRTGAPLRGVVQPTTGAQAKQQASAMPVALDLGDTGAGVDPSPLLDHPPTAISERTHL
jgi:RNA polymerase sigma-70 factor (ECF subfamily)